MARRKKDSADGAEDVKPSDVSRMPSARTLKGLLKTAKATQAATQEAAGQFGNEVKNAVENQNLNRKAFSMLRQFDKMEAEKAADVYEHLLAYMDLSGVMKKIESVQRLPIGDAAADDGDDGDEGDEPGPTVTRFPQAGMGTVGRGNTGS